MVEEIHYNVSTTSTPDWKKAKEIHYYDGTLWKKAKEIHYYDGTLWRKVFGGVVPISLDPVLSSNLLYYYKMDSIVSSNFPDSKSGNGLNYGGNSVSTGGIINNCCIAEGGDDMVIDDNWDMDGGEWTVSMWVKFRTLPNEDCLFRIYDADGYFEFGFNEANRFIFDTKWDDGADGWDNWHNVSPAIVINTWYHIALVCGWDDDDNHIRLYINGVRVKQWKTNDDVQIYPNFTDNVRIAINQVGEDSQLNRENFDGYYDEIGFWDKDSDDSDILKLYNSGNALPYD